MRLSLPLLLLATTLFFIGLSIWLWNRPSPLAPTETRQLEREGIRTTAIAALWDVLLNKGQQTDLVLADSTLTILQDHGGNPPPSTRSCNANSRMRSPRTSPRTNGPEPWRSSTDATPASPMSNWSERFSSYANQISQCQS